MKRETYSYIILVSIFAIILSLLVSSPSTYAGTGGGGGEGLAEGCKGKACGGGGEGRTTTVTTSITTTTALFCGDGIITPPEQCEPPNSLINLHCPQNTTSCQGNQTGNRNPFGNCNSTCGCSQTPFTYNCVKGSCGATCSADSDCTNKCVGTVRYFSGTCGSNSCSCSFQSEDCGVGSGWYDTSNFSCDGGCMRCKSQEFRVFGCSPNSCTFSVNATRQVCENAPSGQNCQSGTFTSSGFCGSSTPYCGSGCSVSTNNLECNGNNNCNQVVSTNTSFCPADTSCSAGVCSGFTSCGSGGNVCTNSCNFASQLFRCNGFGTCSNFWQFVNQSSCSPYTCGSGSCTSTCNTGCGAACNSGDTQTQNVSCTTSQGCPGMKTQQRLCQNSNCQFGPWSDITSCQGTGVGCCGFIKIFKFYDANQNGIWDNGEAGVPGFTFDVNGNGQDFSLTTLAGGAVFSNCIQPGNYTVTELLPAGWANTTPLTKIVTVSLNTFSEARFGNVQIPSTTTTTTSTTTTSSTTSTTTPFTTTTIAGCSGSLVVSANTSVCPNDLVRLTASGFSVGCGDPFIVKFKEGSCSGPELARCTINRDGNCMAAVSFSDTNTHQIFGCVDLNNDNDFKDAGESSPITINVNCNNCNFFSCTPGICNSCSQCGGPGGTYTNQFNSNKCVNNDQSCSYSCVQGQCGAVSCPNSSPQQNSNPQTNGVTLLNSKGCTFSQLTCPSGYSSCSYQLTRNLGTMSFISCDWANMRTNPGTLLPGQSLCPDFDSRNGFSSRVTCKLVGYPG